jgi:hypothetical protein
MSLFKLPLSGDVSQQISPFSNWFSGAGNQYGLINITVGQSSAPEVEADALIRVGSYGMQIGKITDALIVLLDHFHPVKELTPAEDLAIDELYVMLDLIAKVKEKHGRPSSRPRPRPAKDRHDFEGVPV